MESLLSDNMETGCRLACIGKTSSYIHCVQVWGQALDDSHTELVL